MFGRSVYQIGAAVNKGRRFYVVRVRGAASTEVWVSVHSVAHAYSVAGEPRNAEWASVYAHGEAGALARAMGRKVRLKWQPYTGVGSTVRP